MAYVAAINHNLTGLSRGDATARALTTQIKLGADSKIAGFATASGAGAIVGTASLNGSVGVCVCVLHKDGSGAPIAMTPSQSDGTYRFDDLAGGNYAVSVFDPAGGFRAKVVHTVVP